MSLQIKVWMMTGFEDFIAQYDLEISPDILLEACTHPSYRLEDLQIKTYEQMETLGDAVLDVLVTTWIISKQSDIQPGELTRQRSIMVNNRSLSQLGRLIGIASLIRSASTYTLGQKDIANVVEAIFGALYYNGGMQQAQQFFDQIIEHLTQLTSIYNSSDVLYNPVSRLQEFCQKHGYHLPTYLLIEKQGFDHNPHFVYQVSIELGDHKMESQGEGKSKKEARADAANKLIQQLT